MTSPQKVFLLHPEDRIHEKHVRGSWDRIIDFGRAPVSTYQRWSRECNCEATSIYDLAAEINDLEELKHLLQSGLGQLIDPYGLDWWDILSVLLVSDLQKLLLVTRLAAELSPGCELHASRPDPFFAALAHRLGVELTVQSQSRVWRRLVHYRSAARSLDLAQLFQVVQDKFDPRHSIRRRLAKAPLKSRNPVILLPSAYINVSRIAIQYSACMPEQQFLLVYGRNSGKLNSLPANVCSAALDGYFTAIDRRELARLEMSWQGLKEFLISGHEEFRLAELGGVLHRIPGDLRWGIAIRNAWLNVLESHNIIGCLCADDTNPYSRIPLILGARSGVATVSCHHGALDYQMRFKTQYADHYLAKSEMEQDYLRRVCKLPPDRIARLGNKTSKDFASGKKEFAVLFTEPYHSWGWRRDEVYRDLLRRLLSAIDRCGLKLVLKLHPFESVAGHRRMLKQILPAAAMKRVQIVGGPASDELWRATKFAITVQSTTALECAERGIPVFLCSWLRDSYSGYVEQFVRFGLGHKLHSPDDVDRIPELLDTVVRSPSAAWDARDPDKLRALFNRAAAGEAEQNLAACTALR
jgi:hypothetical protein